MQDYEPTHPWTHYIVNVPPGPFHVEAIVRDPSRNIAFLDPREVGTLSAAARGIMDSDLRVLFAGLGLWMGLVLFQKLTSRVPEEKAAGPISLPIPAAELPWMAATDRL